MNNSNTILLGKVLAAQLRPVLCYDTARGCFFIWVGNYWMPDVSGDYHTQRLVMLRVTKYKKETLRPYINTDLHERLENTIDSIVSTSMIRSIISFLKISSLAHSNRTWDPNDGHIHFNNGSFNVSNGKLAESNFKDFNRSRIPIDYDSSSNCPMWDKFLEQIFCNDYQLIHYVQKVIGYCSLGYTSEQKMWFLLGDGRNGKSTFLNVLSHIMGEDYWCDTPSDMFLERRVSNNASYDLARIEGRRCMYSQEIAQGSYLQENIVKQLTGGDKITTRQIRQEHRSYRPKAKFLVASNYMPQYHADSYAIQRRIRIIPFNFRVEENQVDPCLENKLLNESQGILKWITEGARRWKQEGLGPDFDTIMPKEGIQHSLGTLDFYHYCENNFARSEIKASVLYETYTKWARVNCVMPLSIKSFGEEMIALGANRTRKRNCRIYCF